MMCLQMVSSFRAEVMPLIHLIYAEPGTMLDARV